MTIAPVAVADVNPATAASADGALMDIIDFKWLMAGAGHRVHVERMQADPAYARACLCQGVESPVAPLRACALRLARSLGQALNGPH